MRRAVFVAVLMMLGAAGDAQKLAAKKISYSSMKYLPGPDDVVGWDVRMRVVPDGFDATLYCGMGEVRGPVLAHLASMTGKQVAKPASDVCGQKLTLDFRDGTLFVTADEGTADRVPRRKNYMSEDRFR